MPNSSKNSIEGLHDEMLKVKITSAAEKGKANTSLKKFLARKLGLKGSQITIISGSTNPVKKLKIGDITIASFLERIK